MVGVPKSNGCLGCRKRKVKCDQKSPTCDRCKRTGRVCFYPSKFHFVDGNATSSSSSTAANWNLSLPTRQNVYTFTTETLTDGGGLFQKWHCSGAKTPLTINSEPELTPRERQSFQLITCFEQGYLGARMHWLGGWLTLVPQRIGLSAALDYSVRLMVSVHTATLYGRSPSTIIGSGAYIQAIQKLRKALADPVECYSVETLAAAAILYYLEVILGSPFESNFVHHVGGISRLLEARGPSKHKTGFEMHIARQLRGPVAARAVQLGVPCFLASPPWTNFFESHKSPSETTALTQELLQPIIFWSDLTIEVRKYHNGQLSATANNDLRWRLSKIKVCLDSFDVAVEELFASEAHVSEVKSVRNHPISETVFDFKDYTVALQLALHDSYALIVNRMMYVLDQSNNTSKSDWSESWNAQTARLLIRICRSYEYAWKLRPMGAQYMHFPLTMAFPHAQTEVMRTWILQALNDLDEHRMLPTPRFTAFSVNYVANLYTGDNPPVSAPSL